jgi:hypothetical protein
MSMNQLIVTPDFVAFADPIAIDAVRPTDGFIVALCVHQLAAEYFIGVPSPHATPINVGQIDWCQYVLCVAVD